MKKFAHSALTSLVALALSSTSLVPPTFAAVQQGSAQSLPAECRGVVNDRAARGQVFYRGASGPQEIGGAVADGLSRDRSGRTVIRPAERGDQAYTTPLQLFCALKQIDNRATNLNSVADLPAYLNALVAEDPPEGRVWSACLTSYGVRMRCQLRAFNRGEKVWVNPQTAVSVFMQSCLNPIHGPERPKECYVFTLNYREQRDVRWTQSPQGQQDALVTFHTSLSEEEMRRMYSDDCLFVEDQYGRRKPQMSCPEALCPPGSSWPTLELAQRVGLPPNAPSTLAFSLQNGVGRLSVPIEAARRFDWVVPCVYVNLYPVSVEGYRGYQAVSRFDVALSGEIRPSIPSGRFPRPFVGASRY
jgi:hypothetical protein